jgi:outer membrane cobalamin receptor
VVEEREVHELPLPTRNYQQLLGLQPGTSIPLTNNIALGRGDVDINVNGQQATSNNVLIDGIQVNSIGTNSTPNIPVPSIDAVEEFIVQTSLYDATQGRNTGGNVALITKSGTNKLHGSAFEFFRNDAFNANDYFLKQQGQPRPELKKNQYGITLGGPLVKDKTFFFISYQGQREVNGTDPVSSLSSLNIPSGLTSDRSTATLTAYATLLGTAVP